MNRIKIAKISVKHLFGLYDYVITPNTNSNFLILYGDNGCGKSSILSIIFHALHPEPKDGHRTAISKIPFLDFIITLSNNEVIRLHRDSIEKKEYSIIFSEKNIEYKWVEKDDSDFFEKIDNEESYILYCEYLRKLNFHTVYLDANRKIDVSREREYEIVHTSTGIARFSKYDELEIKQPTLRDIISGFHRWLHRSMISGTDEGNKNITNQYLSIIDKTSKHSKKENASIEETKKTMEELEILSIPYIKYGLTVELFPQKFKEKLENIPSSSWTTMYPIIESYISTLKLRLDALLPLKNKLVEMDKYLNSFFKNKKIRIHATDGLLIESSNGQPLSLDQLSSGEKQILYLFCKVISSSDNALIMIIDEPEISLNIKWQEKFLDAINSFIGNDPVQVIIASHSIDLINPYIDSVSRLDSGENL